MTTRTIIIIDRPVWIRETFYMDIPDHIQGADALREYIDAHLTEEAVTSRIGEEELSQVLGLSTEYMIDYEPLED